MSGTTIKLVFRILFLVIILYITRFVIANKSITRKDIQAEVIINSSASRVWQSLLDFKTYPQWNPFIRNMAGTASPGEKLKAKMHLGKLTMTLRPTVLVVEPERELRWIGRLYVQGLFDGEHSFIIEPLSGNQVRFIQREEFNGLLIPFFTSLLKDTRKSFNDMNRALKERAESSN